MRLPKPFYQLPVRIDPDRLRAEIAALPAEAWAAHPDRVPGNSALRLITADGLESDEVTGRMLPTPWLRSAPYLRQVLASFGVVWSRARLMRLAPRTGVPEHADINYNWHTRVRVHIPVQTSADVRFVCDGESVHMAAGEAWIFDNWRRHRVENDYAGERIHLVADTTGTSAFWRFACAPPPPPNQWRSVPCRPEVDAWPLTEADQRSPVMPAAEVQWLCEDLESELAGTAGTPQPAERIAHVRAIVESFVLDWRQLCALHGTQGAGRDEFQKLISTARAALQSVSDGLVMRMNGASAFLVFEKRILNHLLGPVAAKTAPARPAPPPRDRRLDRPVFIVAAPRSGSTLLFETLACTPGFNTLGGEAHWLIEDIPALRPGAPGVDSNRLTAENATADVVASIRQTLLERLQGPGDRAPSGTAVLLEKTPKNSLRIPFLAKVFPDARFIFLWRDPRENISSIMEAWRAGGWVTYRQLPGWEGPWSLLLPPGWASLRQASLEEIAAWQWRTANETVLTDLESLPRDRWTVVGYPDLVGAPRPAIQRLCNFAGVPYDAALEARTSATLPLSRYTHTPPAPVKWRHNAEAIARVIPASEDCWRRLRDLG